MGLMRRIDWDRDDDDINYGDDMRLEYRGEPFTGEVVQDHRPEGALLSQKFYENGIENGPTREWWSDGRLKSEGYIRRGVAIGVFRRWHLNGRGGLAEEKHFDESGSLFKVLEWDEDGDLLEPPVRKLAALARTVPLAEHQWRTRARVRIAHETGVTTAGPAESRFDRTYRVGEELTMFRGGRAGSTGGPPTNVGVDRASPRAPNEAVSTEALSDLRKGPLTWVGRPGLEPGTYGLKVSRHLVRISAYK
jgi:hypothetical protein